MFLLSTVSPPEPLDREVVAMIELALARAGFSHKAAAVLILRARTGEPDLERARQWINRHIPPNRVRYVGRSLRVYRDDVEAALPSRQERVS